MKYEPSWKTPSKPLPGKSAARSAFKPIISVKGAREHNLRNIDLDVPRDQIVVFTGPSGSGKSSLVFDTIHAEGQRRYIESLSTYARQFIDQGRKPEVERIDGLSPTISIDQKTVSANPRSTVGTITEIHDFLRLLYSKIADVRCWQCGQELISRTHQSIVDSILSHARGTRLTIFAPIVRGRKGEHQKEIRDLAQRGFVRIRINGVLQDIDAELDLDKNKRNDIDVSIDRIVVDRDKPDLRSRLEESVQLALKLGQGQLILDNNGTESFQSTKHSCPNCDISYPNPEPNFFSFNSPKGACPDCEGLGYIEEEEPEVDDNSPIHSPENEPCPGCKGARLRKESLCYRIGGLSIFDVSELPLDRISEKLTSVLKQHPVAELVLKEILGRVSFLNAVGAGYLTLNRRASSLSGGERQRIRLATQIGSSLNGVIYVLDEPSIGLHARDTARLLETLRRLRDSGNTVLVVEHDRETIEAADRVVEIGPGAGKNGGSVVDSGTPQEITRRGISSTGRYLSRAFQAVRDPVVSKQSIQVRGASIHNLKNVDASFPLGVLTGISGVSGSGKSSLVLDTLIPILRAHVDKKPFPKSLAKSAVGLDQIDKVIEIDQSPIGRTPRSNPATYTGVFDLIRSLFTNLPDAKIRGYAPGKFSFNVPGGRCEKCEGDGVRKIEMHFLPDVYVTCEQCQGKRYLPETLSVLYKGKSIADVLALSIDDAVEFFSAIPPLRMKLSLLKDVGLGYLTLGQSATTLSGGEAQRLKIARELSRRDSGKTLYVLDEPSTGLHFDDIRKLMDILWLLVGRGNTVILIEHNLDMLREVDHVIDLGPDAGDRGGEIVFAGTPEELMRAKGNQTGIFLSRSFEKKN